MYILWRFRTFGYVGARRIARVINAADVAVVAKVIYIGGRAMAGTSADGIEWTESFFSVSVWLHVFSEHIVNSGYLWKLSVMLAPARGLYGYVARVLHT